MLTATEKQTIQDAITNGSTIEQAVDAWADTIGYRFRDGFFFETDVADAKPEDWVGGCDESHYPDSHFAQDLAFLLYHYTRGDSLNQVVERINGTGLCYELSDAVDLMPACILREEDRVAAC